MLGDDYGHDFVNTSEQQQLFQPTGTEYQITSANHPCTKQELYRMTQPNTTDSTTQAGTHHFRADVLTVST